MKYVIVLIILAAVYFLFFQGQPSIEREAGILAPEEPVQLNLKKRESFTTGEYRVDKLAEFHIKARVLSKKKYRSGREKDLSRYDLAMGWGPMSDSRVLDEIEISQKNRWYYWKTKHFPIPRKDIETHSANMHMLTDDEDIEKELGRVKKGNTVELKGYLVYVEAGDGWRWKSSLTRNDTGGGSCEVIWVEEFRILD